MGIARSVVRQSLRGLGLARIRHPSFADLMQHERIDVVLDVGANEGQYAREIREHGYKGRIASFEPVQRVYHMLERCARRDPLWDPHHLGIGDRDGDLTISVAETTAFSSFKPTTAYTAGKFVGARETQRESVPVVRLDSFLARHPEYLRTTYLKIDTQGFEREVLVGAGDLVTRFAAIQLELPLRELYQGQASMMDMIVWLEARGFEIAMAKENGVDWDRMRLLELDMVFVRG